MRAVVEGRLEPDADAFSTHIDRCLGCRACEPVCPSGVEYGFLLEAARATLAETRGVDAPTRMLVFAWGRRLPSIVSALGARLLRRTGIASLLATRLPKRFGTLTFAMAMLASSTPRRRLRDRHKDAKTAASPPALDAPRQRVAVLRGCVQQGLFARVNRATVRVLEANGCAVAESRGQRCCGALHAHAGRHERARELAKANIAAFEASGADLFVVNAAGCGAIMKEYGKHFDDDPPWAERARRFSARVRDLSEMLAAIGPLPGAEVDLAVTYDAPCHLHHGQRITDAPIAVLRTVPGLRLVPLPAADECCGGAGLYGMLHPDLGGRILGDKVEAVRGTGADAVVTPNPGCMMQIGAGLVLSGAEMAVLHPIEIVDESYRRAGFYRGRRRSGE
jgi:glycolate oxidase iron-sulfur subunit